jgi:hypothetical protein
MAILATTLAVTAFLAYEFLLITRTDDLESILRREIQHFERSLPHFVAGVAEEEARRWPQLSLLRLPANRGKGAAVREGMLRATGAERRPGGQ